MQCLTCKQNRPEHFYHCGLSNCPFGNEPRDPLLAEREKTHGSFEINAEIFDSLLNAMGPYANKVNTTQHMACIMIFMKLARIHSGKANVRDHWDDIAGYAKLGSEACE